MEDKNGNFFLQNMSFQGVCLDREFGNKSRCLSKHITNITQGIDNKEFKNRNYSAWKW